MRNYSVLMAVYHKEEPEYLRQAIESIQVQTVPTNDFVLVCDGPLNPELDAVIATKKQEMGNTLNVVRLAKNCGLGNALNEGILTKTERLMMSNRPPDPKNARNKNVLVVGGSGSGKTRFWLKPNLLQCHSSYVVTDPKGSL